VSKKILVLEFHRRDYQAIQRAARLARMGVHDFAALAAWRVARETLEEARTGRREAAK